MGEREEFGMVTRECQKSKRVKLLLFEAEYEKALTRRSIKLSKSLSKKVAE